MHTNMHITDIQYIFSLVFLVSHSVSLTYTLTQTAVFGLARDVITHNTLSEINKTFLFMKAV